MKTRLFPSAPGLQGAGSAQDHTAEEAANIAVIEQFMRALVVDHDRAVLASLIADDFTSANPAIAGKAGMVGFIDYLEKEAPRAKIMEQSHLLADGDMVVSHYAFAHDADKGTDARIADFFRLKGGKIIAYWDVITEVPAVK